MGLELTLVVDIQSLLIVHLTCKLGFQVNDSVTGLKLLEQGLSKEDLAVAVLLDFPAQMIAGWLVAKWSRPSSSKHPLTAGTGSLLKPWVYAFWARLGMALVATAVVRSFPKDGNVTTSYLAVVVVTTLLSSLTSCVSILLLFADGDTHATQYHPIHWHLRVPYAYCRPACRWIINDGELALVPSQTAAEAGSAPQHRFEPRRHPSQTHHSPSSRPFHLLWLFDRRSNRSSFGPERMSRPTR